MKRQAMVILAAMMLAAVATATAQSWYWGRTAVVASGALLLQDGTFSDRYQVLYVADRLHQPTCVMVVRDAVTAQFEATAVDAGSCQR